VVEVFNKSGYSRLGPYIGFPFRCSLDPDFKTRGFGLENSQIRYPDRLARLILVMALALYFAVSTGQWDAAHHATPAERRHPEQQPKNVLRSMTSWFTRGLRRIANLFQTHQPIPQLWGIPATDRC